MVALRKLFQADRKLHRRSNGSEVDSTSKRQPYVDDVRHAVHSKRADFGLEDGSSPAYPSTDWRATHGDDLTHQFDQIESHFADLNYDREQSAQDRPTHQTLLKPSSHRGSDSNARHVDLMAAVATSEPPMICSASDALSSANVYNEDVAERNMTRFLRIQYRSGLSRSRLFSALYQEDVADRNIAKYSKGTSSLTLSSQSSTPTPGKVRNHSADPRRKGPMGKVNWTSDGDLRANVASLPTRDTESGCSPVSTALRQWNSVPSLSVDDVKAEAASTNPPIQLLGVPPAHKQGPRWSHAPLPDSPTLPITVIPTSETPGPGVEHSSAPRPANIAAPSPSATPRMLSPSSRGLTSSRRNVRDLSIDTGLAAQSRTDIAHRAIQPPTPSSFETHLTPSIAEIMHSPLPQLTPREPSPNSKVLEMMDLFNRMYFSTQPVTNHPAFETLQDAIVREINSHDAFKRVSVPDMGPPFTPSPAQDMFDNQPCPPEPGLSRSLSARSLSKIMRGSSFSKRSRYAENRTSTSTSVSHKPRESLLRKLSTASSRRRHTDAPAPSPGLLGDNSLVQGIASVPPPSHIEGVSDTSNDALSSSTPARSWSLRKHSNRDSTSTTPSVGQFLPERAITPGSIGSIHYLQAKSTCPRDYQDRDTHEDSDDDIIHLPSVALPPRRVRVDAVDENNVRYMIDPSVSADAHRLINWPRRSNRGTPSFCAATNPLDLDTSTIQTF
ncbi:hypothetical protein N7539_003625 [Penicillium diatomitis]|uniref:Uncharacterized protein n=1 Tax=Penicillium diatomitis TaxID=2819901 RepID=A0A9W9XCB0_9EURO|nr:uncharacterized protein N7539_003625 [Penicillium diatomitis]KAJ5488735.1 hypothetical protein N7539_003625 [Penicillium diatomitis]